MGFYGKKVPAKINKAFNAILKARDDCLQFIESELRLGKMPIGKDVDKVGCDVLIKAGYKKNILHRTGHSIGFHSPHGKHGHLSLKNEEPILSNIGYTIEPGVYFKGEFGVRSEVNFYVTKSKQLILTTSVQRDLVRI